MAPSGFHREKEAASCNTVQLCCFFPSRPSEDQKKQLVSRAACTRLCAPSSSQVTHTAQHTHRSCRASVMSHKSLVGLKGVNPSSNIPAPLHSKTCTGPAEDEKGHTRMLQGVTVGFYGSQANRQTVLS